MKPLTKSNNLNEIDKNKIWRRKWVLNKSLLDKLINTFDFQIGIWFLIIV